MAQEIFDWVLLLGRWLHITTAMAWIGTSIFFMWLDRSFEHDKDSKTPGHVGNLWMVHGGGFYHVEKIQMGPSQVPDHLHWFKWESYWTWMSGLLLITLIFYTGGGAFLLDSSVSHVTYWQAVAIAVFSIVGSWFFYDLLWESRFTKNHPLSGHALTLLWFAGMSYFLFETLSGRAAYIHAGAMLGTWMTANVFLRIIPRQVKMVEASKKGDPVNQDWGKNAKNRSTHNTYFTLPVIFIMLSNHFPSTYGNQHGWFILLGMSAAGAAIRHYFVIRLANPPRAKSFLAVGVTLILATMLGTLENRGAAPSLSAENRAARGAVLSTAPKGPAGSVQGLVKFDGVPPQGDRLILPPGCSTTNRQDIRSNEILVRNGKLKNVLIHVVEGLEGRVFEDIPQETVKLDQIDCLYEPRLIAARAGQSVEFINSDSIFHNVKSITKFNETFNVATPNKGDRFIKIFNKGELAIQTKCSLHPWMSASIAVMEHPYFQVTGDDGSFDIKGLPPGRYTLEAWHEVFGTRRAEIEIEADKTFQIEFTFKK